MESPDLEDLELWNSFSYYPAITTFDFLIGQRCKYLGKDKVKKAFDNGDLSRTFLTNMEAAHLSKIATDIETYLMWGHGGRVRQDGPDDVRLSVGLWRIL